MAEAAGPYRQQDIRGRPVTGTIARPDVGHDIRSTTFSGAARQGWWTTRGFAVLAVLAALIPMLWPAIPPLTDVPGHIGRYRILADAGTGPLAQHYDVRWALIGNLGVDLLVMALHPLLDVEPAARLVIGLIPAMTVAAMLWVAYEAHGRIPAMAGFALPLAYSYPFQLGFVNFCLGAAMALAGLALWIRLARTHPIWVRMVMLTPYAGLTWLCHSFGWAMLGLFVIGAEWSLRMRRGEPWIEAAFAAGLMALPMAWPLLIMIGSGGDRLAGDTGKWFRWSAKAQWLVSMLRERWKAYDIAGVVLIVCAVWTAIRSPSMRFIGVLGIPALSGLITFVMLPLMFQGGAGVDMRMLPYAAALAVLAIRIEPDHDALARRAAAIGAAFFAVRIATTTIAFILFSQGQSRALEALNAIPRAAAVLVLVNEPNMTSWFNPRLTHIAGLAVARREAFDNEQWALAGQQLIHPRHPDAAPFDRDPSQIVHPPGTEDQTIDFDKAIRAFDRCTFQRVWTIGFPVGRAQSADLVPIWSDGRSAVYSVAFDHAGCLSKGPLRR
ncbi:hypothetical protein [Sphingomonas albertensis]|uniref:Glycosyltransferase RgtA/B/C/D-like domain-containing protein n=1 Tax=Sphingomonas albertensis TaxID=2762591 RepID=A0ABR7AIX8_9SPHN|nr:hypothetical protein [Sphingomonas albertensis]